MQERYSLVGWLAIAGALILPPALILALLYDQDPAARAPLLPLVMSLGFMATGFSLYPLYRLRHLLNHRYRFHHVDVLIALLIMGGVMTALVLILGRLFSPLGADALLPFFLMLLGVGVPTSVFGLSFGFRLLRLEPVCGGLTRPLAYTVVVASLCFLSVILAPLGFVLLSAADLFLGLIFLREERASAATEFV